MITPKEVFEKADKLFYKVVSSYFKNEQMFPLVVPSNKKITGTNFSEWQKDLVPLFEGSKDAKGKGYKVDWKVKKINGSKQSVPSKIYFETFDDYLHFIRRVQDFKKIDNVRTFTISNWPLLGAWTASHPSLLLEHSEQWGDLLKVCSYFVNSKPPHDYYYVRELPIEVHSKFIEQNTEILKRLLDQLLSKDQINLGERDFASRYYLKKPSIYTQIRILDDQLKSHLGYSDVALTLDDAAWINWTPKNVFLIENQICYLTFPKVKDSVAIFGEGFKSRLSKHLPWLEKTMLYCWFDLDAAGFEMLNMVRQYYPNAKPLFMDRQTLSKFIAFAVENKPRRKELLRLSNTELEMYHSLVVGAIRLEQERIDQQYILENLKGLLA